MAHQWSNHAGTTTLIDIKRRRIRCTRPTSGKSAQAGAKRLACARCVDPAERPDNAQCGRKIQLEAAHCVRHEHPEYANRLERFHQRIGKTPRPFDLDGTDGHFRFPSLDPG
jgi:hypothetical protein